MVRKKKKVKHTTRNVVIVLLAILGGFIAAILILDWTGVADTLSNDDESDDGWMGSGISENDWFDSSQGADWQNYSHTIDPTVGGTLPGTFELEGEFYFANLSDFGMVTWTRQTANDDGGQDSFRGFLVYYVGYNATLNVTYLEGLLEASLSGMGVTWEVYTDSPIEMTVDDHGLMDVKCQYLNPDTPANDDIEGMVFYKSYRCTSSNRWYTPCYIVVKNQTSNDWSDTAAIEEAKIVFESFTCHD